MTDNFDDIYGSDGQSQAEQSEQDRGSYAYISEGTQKPAKKKQFMGLRAILFVLCLAVVSGVSIQAYKLLNSDSPVVTEFNAPAERDRRPDDEGDMRPVSDREEEGSSPTWMELASRTDAKYLPDIVDEIEPSVVGVSATFEYTETYMTWGGYQTQTQYPVSTGTGIVMREDGYIVTNAHVIYDDSQYKCGEAIEVSVMFSDQSVVDANIVAYDRETDIAVLKVNMTGLKPAVFGDSDDLRVGEMVIAVGNPLGFNLFGTVTCGIVSALNREITINEKNMTLIQTDAAINAGNSGGPLLNDCGQVIGINSAKLSSSYSGSASVEGLGFAIPINAASVIINDLINYKYVKGRPQIGISTLDVTESDSIYNNIPMGVYIYSIEEGSAADKAGLKARDIIIDIEGNVVTTAAELNKIKNQYNVGDTIKLIVNRGGEDIEIELVLQEANAGIKEDDDEQEPYFQNDDDLTEN